MVCMALFVRYMYTAAVLGCSNFPAAFLSIQSFLWVGLRVQCKDMVCMALFVRYMYTAAVLGCSTLSAALLPTAVNLQ